MNPAEKKALLSSVQELIPHQEDEATIESYTRHYFWKWYMQQLAQNKTIELEAFFNTIPESCRKTHAERKKEFLLKHKELLALVADQVEELTTKKK